MNKKLAITMGDPAGIGPEIIVKALNKKEIYKQCLPIVIGDLEAMRDAVRFTNSNLKINEIKNLEEAKNEYGTIDLINMGFLTPSSWEYRKVSKLTGEASFQYVKNAIMMTLDHTFDAIVTGPINKEAIHMAGHKFSGHTEILAHFAGTDKFAMLLAGDNLRVIHVTTHVSMEEACRRITKQRVFDTIELADRGACLLGIKKPRIGVAGFNAHCSENGLFGTQEADAIIPAVELAQSKGMNIEGPVPPDTVFVKALSGKYDVVVAMYHDQGHIPIKLLGFKMDSGTGKCSMSGINCTIGLPFIRTSVDHGTAYDRAGEGRANEESMVEAIEAAITMSNNLKPDGRQVV